MIIEAELINQPYSGQYEEKIYDIPSTGSSQRWTWVKFLSDNFTEWCGVFRGSPRNIAISKKYNSILILTSDNLYQLDCPSEELIEYESQTQYRNLTVTPQGDFIVADDYHIDLIEPTLKDIKTLESPIGMDMIKFHDWSNNKLLITCEEFLNCYNLVELELDGETLEITIKNTNT